MLRKVKTIKFMKIRGVPVQTTNTQQVVQDSLFLKWGSEFCYLFPRSDGFNLTFKRTKILEQKMDLN